MFTRLSETKIQITWFKAALKFGPEILGIIFGHYISHAGRYGNSGHCDPLGHQFKTVTTSFSMFFPKCPK
jgi:hypothetical protein